MARSSRLAVCALSPLSRASAETASLVLSATRSSSSRFFSFSLTLSSSWAITSSTTLAACPSSQLNSLMQSMASAMSALDMYSTRVDFVLFSSSSGVEGALLVEASSSFCSVFFCRVGTGGASPISAEKVVFLPSR